MQMTGNDSFYARNIADDPTENSFETSPEEINDSGGELENAPPPINEEEIEVDGSEEDEEKKQPLVIILSRTQTKGQLQSTILEATKTMTSKGNLIDGVKIHIQGWEKTSIHPAQIKAAKRKYAEAIDCGLIGFLIRYGFIKPAQEAYCIAYAKAQMKGKDRIRFKKIDSKHMVDISKKSGEAYLELLQKMKD